MMRWLPSLASLLALAAPVARAEAQDEQWAVIAVTTARDDLAHLRPIAVSAAAALASTGDRVVDREVVVSSLDAAAAPFDPNVGDLSTRIATLAADALEHAAFGRNEQVLELALPMLAEAESRIAAVGRTDAGARAVGDLCLQVVRARIQLRDPVGASEQARRCMHLVPDIVADPTVHPPAVRDVLAVIRQELEERGGVAVIDGVADDPPSCVVRVNGREVGHTPAVRVRLPEGVYRVQVECAEGTPGRVVTLRVGSSGETDAVVPAMLGQTLDTSTGAGLVYSDVTELRARLPRDARTIATAVAVSRLLAVVREGTGVEIRSYSIERDDTPAVLLGVAVLSEPADPVRSRTEVASLLARPPATAAHSADGERTIPLPGPIVLGGAGAALIAAAIAGGITEARDAELVRMCPVAACPLEARPLADEVAGLALATDVLLALSATLAATGLALTIALPEQSSASVSAGCRVDACVVSVRGAM